MMNKPEIHYIIYPKYGTPYIVDRKTAMNPQETSLLENGISGPFYSREEAEHSLFNTKYVEAKK